MEFAHLFNGVKIIIKPKMVESKRWVFLKNSFENTKKGRWKRRIGHDNKAKMGESKRWVFLENSFVNTKKKGRWKGRIGCNA